MNEYHYVHTRFHLGGITGDCYFLGAGLLKNVERVAFSQTV
jgi:hypothetical protein